MLAAGETLTFDPKLTVVYEPTDTGMLGEVRLTKNKQTKPTATFTVSGLNHSGGFGKLQ